MKYITKEVRIGIAGIVALCVLIYGINWLKGIHMFQQIGRASCRERV